MNLLRIRLLCLRSLDAEVYGESGPRKIVFANSMSSLGKNFTPSYKFRMTIIAVDKSS